MSSYYGSAGHQLQPLAELPAAEGGGATCQAPQMHMSAMPTPTSAPQLQPLSEPAAVQGVSVSPQADVAEARGKDLESDKVDLSLKDAASSSQWESSSTEK